MRIRTLVLGATLSLISAPTFAQQLDNAVNDMTLDTGVVSGLFMPTAAEFLPDGRMIILEYDGSVSLVPAGGGNRSNAGSVPIGQVGFEQGGLGLAVDPMFASNRRVYFYYSVSGSASTNRHRVSWAELNNGQLGNLTEVLTGLYGPANHNGGGIKFGTDGLLYIGTGDTGCNCGCAPGQADNFFPTCLTNLQGKILRITRDGQIPNGNPLVGTQDVPSCGANPRPCSRGPNVLPNANETGAPRGELYNWGFRNAWRFSFDEQTGNMWIGDVGEVTTEEINVSTGPAEHFGWPWREGSAGDPVNACSDTPLSGNCKDPAFEYRHTESPARGQGSVTGGVFSNHCTWPTGLEGLYFFGDYNKGRIWTLTPNANRDSVEPNSRRVIVTGARGPVHFFNGPDGAVYWVDFDGGNIHALRPAQADQCTQDAGAPPADTGVGQPDANEDAGPGTPDVGPQNPDATPNADSGTADASTNPADGGDQTPDAAAVADTGTSTSGGGGGGGGGGTRDSDGCGCAASPTDSGLSWLLFVGLGALWLVRRRR